MKAIAEPNFRNIGVMGDTHGNTMWVLQSIEKFYALGVTHILHLGDFGVWPGANGEGYLRKVNRHLANYQMIMIVTLGNHEHYTRLEERVPSNLIDGFSILEGYENILFAERGQHWNWEGVEFCSLGGANSIDRYSRIPQISWWPEESITLGDVYRTVENGTADIMLTHDCPEGVAILEQLSHHSEAAGWPKEALVYANESRVALRQAVDAVRPELLLHGHYHVYADLQTELGVLGSDESYNLRSICLSEEYTDGNLAILDPVTRDVSLIARR